MRVPDAEGRASLRERYLGALLKSVLRGGTREGVHRSIEELHNSQQFEAVVLAGTELLLLISADTIDDLPLLDTTDLHVRAIVDRLGIAHLEPRLG